MQNKGLVITLAACLALVSAAAVFEKSSFLYVDEEQLVDLTPAARAALNIPEGRTLETLQAEMMAKAQATQN